MKRILPLFITSTANWIGGNTSNGSCQQITQEEVKEMMDIQKVITLNV